MLWDLIQQIQIGNRRNESETLDHRAESLERRVLRLEEKLINTRASLRRLTELLEQRFGEDLNDDGKIGR
jgi:chaperonin cofactor prefoldin